MTVHSHWAKRADIVLRELLKSMPLDTPEAEVRKRIREAYPFGVRKHWPYKVWLRRVQAWLQTRARLGRWDEPAPPALDARRRDQRESDTSTLDIFSLEPTHGTPEGAVPRQPAAQPQGAEGRGEVHHGPHDAHGQAQRRAQRDAARAQPRRQGAADVQPAHPARRLGGQR